MNLAANNKLSISSENQLQELEEELVRMKWDILGLCEVYGKKKRILKLKESMHYTTVVQKMEEQVF